MDLKSLFGRRQEEIIGMDISSWGIKVVGLSGSMEQPVLELLAVFMFELLAALVLELEAVPALVPLAAPVCVLEAVPAAELLAVPVCVLGAVPVAKLLGV